MRIHRLDTRMIERFRRILLCLFSIFCCIAIVSILSPPVIGQEMFGGNSEPKKTETANGADKNLRSLAHVNPTTLAMEMSIPLMSYPGRNGNSLSVDFRYSSKVWRFEDAATWWLGPYNDRQYITDVNALYADRSAAGWTSSLIPPRIEELTPNYNWYGKKYGDSTDSNGLRESFDAVLLGMLDSNHASFGLPNCGAFCTMEVITCNPYCTQRVCATTEWIRCPDQDDLAQVDPVDLSELYYVKRLRVVMPDGSSHEFRQDDQINLCGEFRTGCTVQMEGVFLAVDSSGMTITHDSNGYLLILPGGSKFHFPAAGGNDGLFADSFTDVNGNGMNYGETVDSNNNKHQIWIDTMGRTIEDPLPHNWLSQAQVPGLPSPGATGTPSPETITFPGFNGGTQGFDITWSTLKPRGCETSTASTCTGIDGTVGGALEDQTQKLYYSVPYACNGDQTVDLRPTGSPAPTPEVLFQDGDQGIRPCNGFDIQRDQHGEPIIVGGLPVPTPVRFNAVVLSKIKLPNQQTYEFKYNRHGEISKVIYPTGAYETFVYGTVPSTSTAYSLLNQQMNRGVLERRVYDANATLQQTWTYSATRLGSYPDFYNKTVITSSKGNSATAAGARTETLSYLEPDWSETFGFSEPRAGMPYDERTYDESGAIRSRVLTEYVTRDGTTGWGFTPRRDLRVSRKASIMFEPGSDALVTLSETTYDDSGSSDLSFFPQLNVKSQKSYHYISRTTSQVDEESIAAIAGYFSSANLASVTETDYSYNSTYKDRGIIGLPIETRSLDPANTSNFLAKTQYVYDESGYPLIGPSPAPAPTQWADPGTNLRANVTTAKTWVKETNTWLEKHTQFDVFGNVRKAWATNEPYSSTNLVETEYSGTYSFAYPTKVTAPAPDPGNVTGTNQTSSVTTGYDLTTGLPVSTTDDLGRVTLTEYTDAQNNLDPFLRSTRVKPVIVNGSPTGPITETIYDDVARTVKVRKQLDAANWDEATTYMDSLGRTFKTVAKDAQGDITTETKYDLLGRVLMVSNPYRASETVLWSLTEYDAAGRIVQAREPIANQNPASPSGNVLGTTTFGISTVAGFVGTVVTTNDASGRKGRSITNALGQLIRVDEPTAIGGSADADLGNIATPVQPTKYTYNAYGKMVKVEQGVQTRYFKYDSLGRLIRVRQPEQEVNTALNTTGDPYNNGWTAGFTYDVLGNVVTATDAKGTAITNTYDRLSRVTGRIYSNEPSGVITPGVTFRYDGKGLDVQQNPNVAKGKLTAVSSSVSESRYDYFDNLGRLTRFKQITDGTTYTSLYTYNLGGALTQETYPSGRTVKNEFRTDGDLQRVFGRAPLQRDKTYANSFSYSAAGGIKQLRLGNGKYESARFNSRLQVTGLGVGVSVSNPDLWDTTYQYGELQTNGTVDTSKNTGNIAMQTLLIPGISFVQKYKYDPLYRLTEARETTGSTQNWIQNWTYDKYGNRLTFTQNIGGITTAPNPSVDVNTNRFNTGQGFSYDKNGNVTNDVDPVTNHSRQFVFNGDNKQTQVNDTSTSQTKGQYFYDGEGRRIKKVVPDTGETTVFVYSAGKLIAEYSTTSPPTSPTTSYTTSDHLGSPRVITDTTGQLLSRRDFLPFGEELTINVGGRTNALKYGMADTIRQKFTGYQKDTETSLDFADARMYENRFGRFTAVDPLLASGKSANPQTYNRFSYTSNNPIIRMDSDGADWYYFRELKVNRYGSYRHTSVYWVNDGINLFGKNKWTGPGIIFETAGGNAGKYTALDPYEGRSASFSSRQEAVQKYQSYLSDRNRNVSRGFADTVAGMVADNPITYFLYTWGADAIIGKADENSNVYTVTNRTTNATIFLVSAVVGGAGSLRGPAATLAEGESVVATGQRHHLLSNKIMKALTRSERLNGVFNRQDARFIFNAADDAAHKGYQAWHRRYDSEVVKWIRENPAATEEQFINYLDHLHQQPWLMEHIPNVALKNK